MWADINWTEICRAMWQSVSGLWRMLWNVRMDICHVIGCNHFLQFSLFKGIFFLCLLGTTCLANCIHRYTWIEWNVSTLCAWSVYYNNVCIWCTCSLFFIPIIIWQKCSHICRANNSLLCEHIESLGYFLSVLLGWILLTLFENGLFLIRLVPWLTCPVSVVLMVLYSVWPIPFLTCSLTFAAGSCPSVSVALVTTCI